MRRIKIVKIIVFVDWNSQVWKVRSKKEYEPEPKKTIDKIIKDIAKKLKIFDKDHRFEIHFRLYCGWHKGFQKTPRRRALEIYKQDEEMFSLSSFPFIVIRDISFGDFSISALEKRIVKGTGSHFSGTYDRLDKAKNNVENDKLESMVDTALVSDLIYAASQQIESSWLIVLGEDIDLIPGIYTAERLLEFSSRKIAFFRSEGDKHLKFNDLLDLERLTSDVCV